MNCRNERSLWRTTEIQGLKRRKTCRVLDYSFFLDEEVAELEIVQFLPSSWAQLLICHICF